MLTIWTVNRLTGTRIEYEPRCECEVAEDARIIAKLLSSHLGGTFVVMLRGQGRRTPKPSIAFENGLPVAVRPVYTREAIPA